MILLPRLRSYRLLVSCDRSCLGVHAMYTRAPSECRDPTCQWRSVQVSSVLALSLAAALVVRPAPSSFAHDIPSTSPSWRLFEPEGAASARRHPRSARGDARRELSSDAARAISIWSEQRPCLHDAARLDRRRDQALRERRPARRPAHRRDASLAALRPLVRGLSERARRMCAARRSTTRQIMWKQAMLDVVLDYPIASDRIATFSIEPALARLGVRTTTVLRFLPAGGTERAFEYVGDPGLVRLDPRWYQAALGVRAARVRAHSRRHRPPAVHLLPGHSVPPVPAADRDRHVVHRRALDHADRVGARLCAGRAVVSAADRGADRAVDSSTWRSRTSWPRRERRWLPGSVGAGTDAPALVVAFGSDSCTASAFRSRCASRCSLPARISRRRCCRSTSASSSAAARARRSPIPPLDLVFRYVVAERMGTIILSAFVAHTAWHWMLDRGAVLRLYSRLRSRASTGRRGAARRRSRCLRSWLVGRRPAATA